MSHRTKLIDRLYIGSAPENHLGFDLIVLCAKEYQPKVRVFHPAKVLRLPLEDSEDPMSARMLALIDAYALLISDHWHEGESVLITCQMGRNRSALISALVLSLITDVSLPKCAQYVRATRKDATGVPALQNEYFWSLLVH